MVTGAKKRICQGIAIFIALIIIYYPGYKRVQLAKERNRKLKQRLAELKKENAELEKKLGLLKTDMVYIEKRAREKLGIIGEGEIIYEFVPSQKGKESKEKSEKK